MTWGREKEQTERERGVRQKRKKGLASEPRQKMMPKRGEEESKVRWGVGGGKGLGGRGSNRPGRVRIANQTCTP